jgi:hypothetical protein
MDSRLKHGYLGTVAAKPSFPFLLGYLASPAQGKFFMESLRLRGRLDPASHNLIAGLPGTRYWHIRTELVWPLHVSGNGKEGVE